MPGRNLVFLAYAAALADRRGLKALVGGMCETDYSGYPDCRRDTLEAMLRALNLGMAQDFTLETPLMALTKAQTWALAHRIGGDALVELIVEDSHTCYRGDRTERVAADLIDAELRIRARLHEPGIGEHLELERDRAESDVRHGLVDGAGRQLAVPQQPQNLAAAGRPDGGQEGGIHDLTGT